jgi:hypothetical protein
MKEATKRSILRWIHIIISIPIIGYIYSPFEEFQITPSAVRFVFLPVIVLSGFGCGKAMSFDDLFRKSSRNEIPRIEVQLRVFSLENVFRNAENSFD